MPFYWMLLGSLKNTAEIFAVPPTWIVTQPKFHNYVTIITEPLFQRGMLNSVFISATRTVLTLFFCSLAGFAFAKYPFPGREQLFVLMLGTMMVPGVITWVPVFMVMAKIGWIDTYRAVILPGTASAFGIFLLRQYCVSIPDELLDAARMDGCNEFQIYYKIVAPLMVPALITLAIFSFVWSWNSLFWPLLILRSRAKYTLPLALYIVRSAEEHLTDHGVIFAASTLASAPTVLLFLFLQRYIVGYRLSGALKL